jgi:ribosome biogenesis GTPase
MVVIPTKHYDTLMRGIVTHRSLTSCTAVTESSERLHVLFKNKSQPVVTGDYIQIVKNNESYVLSSIETRTNEFVRANSHLNKEVMASNLTQIAIIMAPSPKPDLLLMDGMIAAAEYLNIKPLLIYNKIDLSELESVFTFHSDLYSFISISAKHRNNLEQLMAFLDNETTLFIGQSGVGKSTLMNRLIGEDHQKISELSKLHGKHTTSASTLYSLSSKTQIIDTPGVRSFLPFFEHQRDIIKGFKDLSNYLGMCRFHNCIHHNEPDCAVIKALESKEISASRFANYQKIYELYTASNS